MRGRLTSVLKGDSLRPPPVWLMRQAGRYLPEYREVRARAGSFLDLCYTPELATEVTLQPLRRFDLDAAILFSDILVIPDALGREVSFVSGHGPRLDPIGPDEIGRLGSQGALERLEPVFETVRRVRASLDPSKDLIGFCGAPWTVATYMIAGHGTVDQAPTRLFAARHRTEFRQLIEVLTEVSAAYLIAQAKAGANVLQIFDSWSGVLGEADFIAWCLEPVRKIVARVRTEVPGIGIIGFPKGAGLMLERYAGETGIDGLGIDWTVPFRHARRALQPRVAVQGNLDPLVLIAGGDALEVAVDKILRELGDGRLIFNLGHGIRPETPIGHVERLVGLVRRGAVAKQAK